MCLVFESDGKTSITSGLVPIVHVLQQLGSYYRNLKKKKRCACFKPFRAKSSFNFVTKFNLYSHSTIALFNRHPFVFCWCGRRGARKNRSLFNLLVFLSEEMPQDCHQVSCSFKLQQSQAFCSPFIQDKTSFTGVLVCVHGGYNVFYRHLIRISLQRTMDVEQTDPLLKQSWPLIGTLNSTYFFFFYLSMPSCYFVLP